MNKRKENPAKTFLRQYKALSGRVDALQREIDRMLLQAQNKGVTLKEIKVLSSPAEHDPMAADVAAAVDASAVLIEEQKRLAATLQEILCAINSLDDDRQKELLTRRYVTGQQFLEISEAMSYGEATVYVIHGRALIGINEWLRKTRRTNQ